MTVPMMRRAALSGWQNAFSYPNALTTGPAAGGYTPNTAVTIATATAINNTGNPSWVSTVGTTLYVQNVNFYLTGGDITVNATTAVTFQGCTFSSSLPASNSGQETLVLSGGGTYTFEYCSMFGSDGTGATRVNEIIDMGADCVIVIDHCNMYNMRQAVDIRDNASAGVTITNSYLHDIVLFTQAPAQPVLTISGTGGSMTAGTYGVVTTYTGPAGESIASPASAATTSGTTSTITITSPASSTYVGGATNWYAYVTQAGGTTYTRQQTSGSPTALGTPYTVTTTPSGSGADAPDGDHSEPIYSGANGSGSNITISGNTILNPVTQTAAIYLHTTEPFTAVTISSNFLAGGSYALYSGGSASSNVVIENNVFSTAYFAAIGSALASPNTAAVYPSVHPSFGSSGNIWTANTWYDGPNAGNTINEP